MHITDYVERARLAQQMHQQSYPVQLELNMSYQRAQLAIETAVEFGERFPDLPEYDVIEHVNGVIGENYVPDNINNPLYRAVMAAYTWKTENNGYDVFAAYTGIDIRPIKEGEVQ